MTPGPSMARAIYFPMFTHRAAILVGIACLTVRPAAHRFPFALNTFQATKGPKRLGYNSIAIVGVNRGICHPVKNYGRDRFDRKLAG